MEDSRIPDLIASGRAHLDQLEEQLRAAQYALTEARKELEITEIRVHELSSEASQVRGYLKALGDEKTAAKSSSKKEKTQEPERKTRRRRRTPLAEDVWGVLSQSNVDAISPSAVAELIGATSASVNRVLRTFEERGYVKQVGQEKSSGAKKRNLFSPVKTPDFITTKEEA